jgi:hypothetical protein
MAQDRVRQWAQRFVPEKADEESRTKRIRVQSDTQVIDTWEAPFPSREDWCNEMEALLACTADQLPIRRHGITFAAEDASGQVLSQCLTSIQGKNKEAAETGANGIKAVADAMNAVAATMDKVMASGRAQLDAATKAFAAISEEVQDLHELHRRKRALETVEDGGDSAIGQVAIAKLEQYAPAILELTEMWLQTKGANPSTNSAVKAITQAVAHTNGKAAS